MTAWGYAVYRYRSRYLVHLSPGGSSPSGLGLDLLRSIPSPTNNFHDFDSWLSLRRLYCDKRLAEWDYMSSSKKKQAVENWVVDEQPVNDFDIEWIYEIDLDRLVFCVDTHPLFRLDCLPPKSVFLRAISFDHYGHRSYAPATPAKHLYHSVFRAPPPEVDTTVLQNYSDLHPATESPTSLLGVTESLSRPHRVRTRLLEVLIGHIMRQPSVGKLVRELEAVTSEGHLVDTAHALTRTLIALAMEPMIYEYRQGDLPRPKRLIKGLWWPRKDVCVSASTHLSDNATMHSAVARLVAEVRRTEVLRSDPTIYGILCSLFHIVLVKIDTSPNSTPEDATFTVAHTPALSFLPSFYATSPSTPGITALARLSCIHDPNLTLSVARTLAPPSFHPRQLRPEVGPATSSLPHTSRLRKLPPELLVQIAFLLTMRNASGDNRKPFDDLLAFSRASWETEAAAAEVLRVPHISSYRLHDIAPSGPPPGTAPETVALQMLTMFDLPAEISSMYWANHSSEPPSPTSLHLYSCTFVAIPLAAQPSPTIHLHVGPLPASFRKPGFYNPLSYHFNDRYDGKDIGRRGAVKLHNEWLGWVEDASRGHNLPFWILEDGGD